MNITVELSHLDESTLSAEFYSRPTVTVAKSLLGKLLQVCTGNLWRSGYIVEDEAYLRNDPACHAFKGPTRRNQSMFKKPGTAYVYRIHQVHCLNTVTRPGEAVLIRALQPAENIGKPTDGPGKLCRALGVTRERHDGLSLTRTEGAVRIVESDGFQGFRIGRSPRIGITKAKDKPLRFFVRGNEFLSR